MADERGRGKESIAPAVRERIFVGATTPPEGQGRWSVRTMANAVGVSKDTVRRLWQRNDISRTSRERSRFPPHLARLIAHLPLHGFHAPQQQHRNADLAPPRRRRVNPR